MRFVLKLDEGLCVCVCVYCNITAAGADRPIYGYMATLCR